MARENKSNREVRRAAMAVAASQQQIMVHRSQELSGPLPSPGQIAALIIGLAGLICGTISAIHGYPWIGGIEGGGTVVSLVTAFLYRQHVVSKAPKETTKPKANSGDIAIPPLMTREEDSK